LQYLPTGVGAELEFPDAEAFSGALRNIPYW
jgi:hypothetical protein